MSWVLVQRHLAYRLAQLGWFGGAGLSLLLAAAITWLVLIQGEEAELLRLQQGLEVLRQQEATKAHLPSNPVLNREEQLAIFYKSFPDELQVPGLLKQVFEAASANGLTIETADYTFVQTGTDRLTRYKLALPVKGTFKQMLAYMDAVLKSSNAIALENASFKRDKVDDAMVEAKLVFVILVDARP